MLDWVLNLKDFYAAGLEAPVKRWDKCINTGGGDVAKLMFFPGTIAFYTHL
jgi:hypothetical protein